MWKVQKSILSDRMTKIGTLIPGIFGESTCSISCKEISGFQLYPSFKRITEFFFSQCLNERRKGSGWDPSCGDINQKLQPSQDTLYIILSISKLLCKWNKWAVKNTMQLSTNFMCSWYWFSWSEYFGLVQKTQETVALLRNNGIVL